MSISAYCMLACMFSLIIDMTLMTSQLVHIYVSYRDSNIYVNENGTHSSVHIYFDSRTTTALVKGGSMLHVDLFT